MICDLQALQILGSTQDIGNSLHRRCQVRVSNPLGGGPLTETLGLSETCYEAFVSTSLNQIPGCRPIARAHVGRCQRSAIASGRTWRKRCSSTGIEQLVVYNTPRLRKQVFSDLFSSDSATFVSKSRSPPSFVTTHHEVQHCTRRSERLCRFCTGPGRARCYGRGNAPMFFGMLHARDTTINMCHKHHSSVHVHQRCTKRCSGSLR